MCTRAGSRLRCSTRRRGHARTSEASSAGPNLPASARQPFACAQDLDDDGIFMLLIRSAPTQLYVWVGADADAEVDPEGAGRSFLDDKGLQGATVTLVAQDEEPEEFWSFFLNG